jgi:hypothetical protein
MGCARPGLFSLAHARALRPAPLLQDLSVWAPLTCEPADIYTPGDYSLGDVAAVLPPSLAEYLAFLATHLPQDWRDSLVAINFKVQPIQVGRGGWPGRLVSACCPVHTPAHAAAGRRPSAAAP